MVAFNTQHPHRGQNFQLPRNYTTLFFSVATNVMKYPDFGKNMKAAWEQAKAAPATMPVFFNAAPEVLAGVAVKRHSSSVMQDMMRIQPADIAGLSGDILAVSLGDEIIVDIAEPRLWKKWHQAVGDIRKNLRSGKTLAVCIDEDSEAQPSMSLLGVHPVNRIHAVRITNGEADIVLRP